MESRGYVIPLAVCLSIPSWLKILHPLSKKLLYGSCLGFEIQASKRNPSTCETLRSLDVVGD